MKTKQLSERELQRVCGGAWARGETGRGMKPGKPAPHMPHHFRRSTKPPLDGGIVPAEPPTWKLLRRIR